MRKAEKSEKTKNLKKLSMSNWDTEDLSTGNPSLIM